MLSLGESYGSTAGGWGSGAITTSHLELTAGMRVVSAFSAGSQIQVMLASFGVISGRLWEDGACFVYLTCLSDFY